jgi:putative protease
VESAATGTEERIAAPGSARPPTGPSDASLAPGTVAGSSPQRVGVVTHYFAHVNAAAVAVEEGELRPGDTVHVRGHTTDYYQRLDRIEIDHAPVDVARSGQTVGVHVAQRVREKDVVYRLAT